MSNANEQSEPKTCHILVKLSPELRSKFKRWSYRNGISMTCGIVSLMETVTSNKKYRVKHRVHEIIEAK